jgi:hypothetical protein
VALFERRLKDFMATVRAIHYYIFPTHTITCVEGVGAAQVSTTATEDTKEDDQEQTKSNDAEVSEIVSKVAQETEVPGCFCT